MKEITIKLTPAELKALQEAERRGYKRASLPGDLLDAGYKLWKAKKEAK